MAEATALLIAAAHLKLAEADLRLALHGRLEVDRFCPSVRGCGGAQLRVAQVAAESGARKPVSRWHVVETGGSVLAAVVLRCASTWTRLSPLAWPQLLWCSFTARPNRSPERGWSSSTRSASAGAVLVARMRVMRIPDATWAALRSCRCTAPPSRVMRGWLLQNRWSSVLPGGGGGAEERSPPAAAPR